MSNAKKRIYTGWRPDTPDKRDRKYQMPMHLANTGLPIRVDLRPKMPEVYNQGELGSCTGQSLAGDVHYQLVKQNGPVWKPSPLFIYYNERVIEGTIRVDGGAELRNGMKALNKWGVCHEDLCPYIIEDFKKKPTRAAYKDAMRHKVFDYRRIPQSLDQLKSVLAQDDPFVFGFMVYESFEHIGSDGMMEMPRPDDVAIGGHAVCAVGYNDDTRRFIIRNSWGKDFGDNGYFYMPYDYIVDDDLAADFWTVRAIDA